MAEDAGEEGAKEQLSMPEIMTRFAGQWAASIEMRPGNECLGPCPPCLPNAPLLIPPIKVEHGHPGP